MVVPTFNRADALRTNLGTMLALEGVCEVIVVNDGSSDDTAATCAEFSDERLKLVEHPHNRGLPAARNTGAANARGAWVLFGEDDCRFPADYAVTLRAVAERHEADIVGAPLVNTPGTDETVAQFAAQIPRRSRAPTMDEDGIFPAADVQTPFLPARSLVRRSVFEKVSFDEGYVGNAYREETDFFVRATRDGFRCVLTGDTYCYQIDTWNGGVHLSSTLRYEYSTLLNNWRFLSRHGAWLKQNGYIRSAVESQTRFALRRLRHVATGVVRARVHRLKSTLDDGQA
jgi:GT2 family glycosyltransferase